MVLRGVGPCLIAKLLRAERLEVESDWLLYGPTDPEVVEDGEAEPPVRWLLAAE